MEELPGEITIAVPLDRGVHAAVRVMIETFQRERHIKVNTISVTWLDVTTLGPRDFTRSYQLGSVVIESEEGGSR